MTVLRVRRLLLLSLVLLIPGCLDETDSRPANAPAPMAAVAPVNSAPVAAVAASAPALAAPAPSLPAVDGQQAGQAASDIAAAIYKGDFKAAAAIMREAGAPGDQKIAALREVVEQHETVAAGRAQFRQEQYQSKLAELDKFRLAAADGNDVNDLSSVFAVVFAARSLAEPNEKAGILSDPFVQTVIARALAEAKENEAAGKWEEALTQCYSWMAVFNEDDKQYKEKRDRLRDMYYISESLTDNACETRDERFGGIKKQMLVQAIKVLDLYHVKILDYDAMAKSAIKRCHALGDVVAKAETFKAVALKRDSGPIAAWQAGLNVFSDQLKDPQLPLSRDKFLDLFDNVLKLNKTTVELPEEIVVAFFAEASLDEVDPYTNLVWPWQITEFEKSMTQEFTGIGIEINKTEGKLSVASLLPDTPASVSGLDAEDVIEKVDGEPTAEMTLQCAVRKITGTAGTKVTLTVRHKGSDKSEDITITRAKIVVPTVRGWQRTDDGKWFYMIDEKYGIGYVRITNFSETTSEQFESVLLQLEKQGMKGLILDLRYNTGGYLQSAVDICDKFIAEGPIVGTRPRFGVRTSEVATKKGTHADYPLVILINGGSASASEIVAGALQDPMYRRALLVGTRSYGKGSVQTVFGFSGDKAQLKYTMAYYHLPSGQRVESQFDAEKAGKKEWGVEPDVKVEMISDEIKNLAEAQRDNDVLSKANHDNLVAPLKRHSAAELMEADPQLNVAVMVVKTELIAGRAVAVKKK